MLGIDKLNEDLKQRKKIILAMEKILKEKQEKDKTKLFEYDLEKSIDDNKIF
jgi:hypothetical protein